MIRCLRQHLRQQTVEPALDESHLLLLVGNEEGGAETVPLLAETNNRGSMRIHAEFAGGEMIVENEGRGVVVNGGGDARGAEEKVGEEDERDREGDEQSTGDVGDWGDTWRSRCGEETGSIGGGSEDEEEELRITVRLAAAARYSRG